MAERTDMVRSTRGFYTVEAAVCLPVLIIAVLSLGYFIKAYCTWENVMHGALDETSHGALKAYDRISDWGTKERIKRRIETDNPQLENVKVNWLLPGSDVADGVICYKVKASERIAMPMQMGGSFSLETAIKYREFIGKRKVDGGMGRLALETESGQNPTVIFPKEGERYHSKACTYAVADVKACVLTDEIRRKHNPCGICKSQDMKTGELVYCFSNERTAYHKSTCSSVDRHVFTMDKSEAIKKGYTPCSKCGGG